MARERWRKRRGELERRQFLVQSITWVARPENQSAFDEDSPPHTDFITRSTVEMETIARDTANKEGFKAAILRCGWFHAPDAAHTRYFGAQLLARKLPIIGKGDAMWQWIHVDDAASAFVTVGGVRAGRPVARDRRSAGERRRVLGRICAAAGCARSTARSSMARKNSGGAGDSEYDDGVHTNVERAVPP